MTPNFWTVVTPTSLKNTICIRVSLLKVSYSGQKSYKHLCLSKFPLHLFVCLPFAPLRKPCVFTSSLNHITVYFRVLKFSRVPLFGLNGAQMSFLACLNTTNLKPSKQWKTSFLFKHRSCLILQFLSFISRFLVCL